MSIQKHLNLLIIVTLAWLIFWLAGLPDYYQQYSKRFMIIFDAVLLPPLWILIYFVLRRVRRRPRLSVAIWLSFYITVPLFFYDFFYCAVYLGHGLGFLAKYWYLTVYYLIPWIIVPLTGLWLDKKGQLC